MNARGMTIKEWWRERFTRLCEEYRTCDPFQDATRFVALSVAIHAAKGHVPRRMWALTRRKDVSP